MNQWIIYDAYTTYEQLKEAQEESEKGKAKKDDQAAATTTSFNIRRLVSG